MVSTTVVFFCGLFIISHLFEYLTVKTIVFLYDLKSFHGANYSNCIDVMLVQIHLAMFYCMWADPLTSLSQDELLCLIIFLFPTINLAAEW